MYMHHQANCVAPSSGEPQSGSTVEFLRPDLTAIFNKMFACSFSWRTNVRWRLA